MKKYGIPGMEMVGGIGTEIVAPGNPIGLGLIGAGAGQMAGGAAGGDKGQALGGMLGGMGGGLYGMAGMPGMSGMLSPSATSMTSGTTPSGGSFQASGMEADVPQGKSSGGMGGLLDNPQAMQMLMPLMQMFGGQGQQGGQQPQTQPHQNIAAQFGAPSQAPTSTVASAQPGGQGGQQDATTNMLMAYLKSQGMLS